MNDPSEFPTTLVEAEQINPYALAERWADRSLWGERAEFGEHGPLEELATMQGIRAWLTRWLPLQLHSALLWGATLAEVCAASGLDAVEVDNAWFRWASRQRELMFGDRPALSEADYRTVAAVLAAGEVGEQ